jgi:hypothetical protein
MKNRSGISATLLVLCGFSLSMLSSPALGDLKDVEQAQQKVQNAFIDHFLNFTKDKNVMGKAKTPDGKAVGEGKKRKFDRDGGGVLPFQSDLTYHDYSYNRTDPNDANKKEEDRSRLFAFVSHHGGVSAAGGSSLLERTAYQLHKELSKEDEKNAKKADQEEGVKFRSLFKITTKEVAKNENAKGADADKPEKIERIEMRDEAKTKIEEVGDQSFETIRRAARDQGKEDDSSILSNGVLLRYAAGQATQAWWNSSQANLGQRRANSGIRAGALPDSPQLSEGIATCDEWGQAAIQGVQESKAPPETLKALQEEIQKKVQQCNQMAGISFKEINPKFVPNDDGKGETLKTGDVAKEDAFQRDLRNQMEVLSKAGKGIGGLQTNWAYEAKDERSKVVIDFDENGQPKAPVDRTVRQQLESYNNQLQEAAKGLEEVKAKMPEMVISGDPLSYQIAPESKSAMEINQTPVVSAFEEANVPEVAAPAKSTNTYKDLLDQE